MRWGWWSWNVRSCFSFTSQKNQHNTTLRSDHNFVKNLLHCWSKFFSCMIFNAIFLESNPRSLLCTLNFTAKIDFPKGKKACAGNAICCLNAFSFRFTLTIKLWFFFFLQTKKQNSPSCKWEICGMNISYRLWLSGGDGKSRWWWWKLYVDILIKKHLKKIETKEKVQKLYFLFTKKPKSVFQKLFSKTKPHKIFNHFCSHYQFSLNSQIEYLSHLRMSIKKGECEFRYQLHVFSLSQKFKFKLIVIANQRANDLIFKWSSLLIFFNRSFLKKKKKLIKQPKGKNQLLLFLSL